ncbi:hypothetical protein A8M77_33410 [Variovorax sp. JS1663]|nr:hypothetical protein A8M77_33410 [Variovorax sp. JS1663]
MQAYFIGPMLGACRMLIQTDVPPARRAVMLKTFMVMIVFGGALAPIAGRLCRSCWRARTSSCSPHRRH